jgi:hypothetical protein
MKWAKFAKEHILISLPASPIHVSLYLVFLLDSGATYNIDLCNAKSSYV